MNLIRDDLTLETASGSWKRECHGTPAAVANYSCRATNELPEIIK
ncbi:MAG: hypothetical protein AAGK57_07425 [Pseudomonadota bacterium]